MSTYASLAQKYNNFSVPSYKVSCGGKEIKRSEFTITELSVDNCIGAAAGAARFTLTHVYERGSRKINANALKNLAPGTKVSISLGYGSSLTEVFTGYIDELKTRFDDDDMVLSAICLDARGLMREGAAYSAVKDKKPQDVVNAVLDKYGALITAKDVKLAAWEQEVNLTQAGTDLDYVVNTAASRGALFYIDCGKAFVGPTQTTVCVEFDWEQFGIDFTIRYLDEKLTAYGYDARKMEPFTADAAVKQSAKQEKLITVARSVRVPHYINKDSAKAHVDALAKRRTAQALYGTLRCVGMPEIRLGQKVKINKFPLTDAGVGASLTVVSVSHRLDNEVGYKTEIGVEG